MSQSAKVKNNENHNRQKRYLAKGIVMLPTLREERRMEKSKNN